MERSSIPLVKVLALSCALACAIATRCPASEHYGHGRYSILADDKLLAPPPGDLTREFSRIAPSKPPLARAVLPDDTTNEPEQSAAVDVDDLGRALAQAKVPADEIGRRVDAYRAKRLEILDHRPDFDWRRPRRADPPGLDIPHNLPREFELYLTGAVAFARKDLDAARQAWLALLDLPERERRWRSVWAAYMLGRCPPANAGPDWAGAWFERTRELAAAGFSDNLGLAAASYGRQASVQWAVGDVAGAVDLHLTHLASGDPRAADSLAAMAAEAFAAGVEKMPVAYRTDRRSIAVLAAFVACGGGPFRRDAPDPVVVRAWFLSLGPATEWPWVDPALLARANYAIDHFVGADFWSSRTSARSPELDWIDARLAIGEDRLADATEHLRRAAERFDKSDARWDRHSALDRPDRSPDFLPARRCMAELGVVLLAREQYVAALECFLRCGDEEAVAYVCERVLQVDELRSLVDRGQPVVRPLRTLDPALAPDARRTVRTLLARRLVRLGRWEEAVPYFDGELGAALTRYQHALARADDGDAYREDRAAALWEAAVIARNHGGSLFQASSDQYRTRWVPREPAALHPGDDERPRARATNAEVKVMADPLQIAADLAWRAAELLPDEDDETARILNIAGRWYDVSDGHEKADRFYKALVRRCATTRIGRAADRHGWFVRIW